MGGEAFFITTNFGILGLGNSRSSSSMACSPRPMNLGLQHSHLLYNLKFARGYEFHLQGIKGEAVTLYRDPLVTKQMEAIGVGNIQV